MQKQAFIHRRIEVGFFVDKGITITKNTILLILCREEAFSGTDIVNNGKIFFRVYMQLSTRVEMGKTRNCVTSVLRNIRQTQSLAIKLIFGYSPKWFHMFLQIATITCVVQV